MPDLVKKWQHISRLMWDRQIVALVTSTEWAELARELKEDYGSSITPTNVNFTQVMIDKNLLIRNSGTEDQEVCNIANNIALGEENLRLLEYRKANFITGKA